MKPVHFDYVLGPPMTSLSSGWTGETALASVAPGTIVGIPLVLDPDAPFVLRSIAARYTYPTHLKSCARTQNDLSNIKIRFTGPNQNYFMQGFVPLNLLSAYFGQLGNPRPLWREVYYPPQSTIVLDLTNAGTTTLTNLTFYFRGVKLFPDNSAHAVYSYPERMSTLPWIYPLIVENLGVTESRLKQPFTVVQDADFVLRAALAGTQDQAFFEVFFILKDENSYPFSSKPVHADTLFGQAGSVPTYIAGGDTVTPIEVGPANPGLFVPEIYVPRQHQLIYDIYRNDSAYSSCTNGAENYPISLIGAKVFPR